MNLRGEFMNRVERLYKIEELLRQRRAVSFAAFLAELEVSRSTLKRDLDYLRHRLHAPIEWDRATGCYRMAAITASAERPHQLPGLWFSSAEIHAQNYLKSAVELLNPDEDEEFVDAKGLKGKVDHPSPVLADSSGQVIGD